jgi:hypothetical protein
MQPTIGGLPSCFNASQATHPILLSRMRLTLPPPLLLLLLLPGP